MARTFQCVPGRRKVALHEDLTTDARRDRPTIGDQRRALVVVVVAVFFFVVTVAMLPRAISTTRANCSGSVVVVFHGALKRLLRTQTCTRSVQLSSSVKWASTIIHMMAFKFDWNPRGLGLLLGSPTLARTPSRLPLNLGHSRKALAARGDGLLHAAPDRRVTFLARSSLGGNSQRRSKASSRSPVMGGWVDALDVISSRMRPWRDAHRFCRISFY